MKKILVTFVGIAASAAMVHAQGLVQFFSLAAGVSNNPTAYGTGYPTLNGATGAKTTAGAGFQYVLLAATSTTSADLGNPLGADWSVVTDNGTNAVAPGGPTPGTVNGPGGSTGFTSNLAAGTTYFEMVVGWSSALGNWATVSALLTGGSWQGNNPGSYVGYSAIGSFTPTAAPSPAAAVFGGSGVPLNSTTLFQAIPTPEPTTLALAGLGGISMLFLRRRKA